MRHVYRTLVDPEGHGPAQTFVGVVHLKPRGIRIGFRVGFIELGSLCWGLYLRRRECDLPTIDEFIGSDPDFTAGMSTKEYIDRMRED